MNRGFTLLDTLLALSLGGIALLSAAYLWRPSPPLRRFASELADTLDSLALVGQSMNAPIEVSLGDGALSVTAGTRKLPPLSIPKGLSVEIRTSARSRLLLYPTGTATPGTIYIAAPNHPTSSSCSLTQALRGMRTVKCLTEEETKS